jgi:hypothetical protein
MGERRVRGDYDRKKRPQKSLLVLQQAFLTIGFKANQRF